ncbi:metabotropic glutamate receptor 8-like [Gigantopelta aegis]|uniref:metabotropic glutamate receptor 8-like n=1 Tax=Gigantopelta aegis TaxID=1735272 RepID=UPI001B88DABD|nr:metabotropic glutamate receptor 8-like [Gigantopelta aegis]
MVDIAKALGWNYVNTIADDGTYGEKGIGAFVEKAANAGICISMSLKIPRSTDESTFRNIVKEILVPKNTAKVVVMFVNEDNCKRLLKALLEINRTSELFFLASDSWGAKIHPVFQQEVAAEGAVTILPKRQRVKAFDHYFLKLDVRHQHNIWFKEFWETIFNCSSEWTAGRKSCTGRESLHDAVVGYEQEGLVQFVIDSVYALAHAIHNMLVDRCPKSSNFRHCKHLKDLAGKDLLEYIRNVSFTGAGGNKVKFDGVGDAVGRYDIYQYQILDTGKYIKIGDWEHRLSINTSAMLWKNGSRQAPKSVCSEPCRNGESKNNMSSCCWMCVPCAASEFLENEFQCRACPKGSRPSVNKTMCAKLPELYLRPHSLWFILPAAFSVFGTLCTCSVFIIFLAFNRTPVIMASGRELCYLLLLGILLSYGTSLAMLAKPNIIFCALQRLGLGVSLCFIYAALLTKTNRIYRIFNSGIKAMVKRPGYTSPRSQIFLCLCLVSVQIVGGLTWLGFETPSIKHVSYQKDYLVLKCRSSQIATMISLFYNMLLIVLCTVYAFKTRKIPQNFNEAKYIAFTMYSTCIVWLAFIPIYFGANHDYKIEVTSLCMCVSISSTVALFCLFAPKVYIVLCQPHKNVRQGSAPSVQITATTKTSRSYSAQAGSNGAQNGSIHREIQCTDSNIFPDSVEENSSCDEGVAMRAPSSCAS